MTHNKYAFTLVEVIVAISIMSVILVAIMGVFFSMSDLGNKTEIQRQLQTNTKNIIQAMSQDIAKYGILQSGCSVLGADAGTFWCNNVGDRYYLGKITEDREYRVATLSDCQDINTQCSLLKNGMPLNNSFTSIKNIDFKVIGDKSIPRLFIRGVFQPSIGKGVKSNLIEKNRFVLQTTLSETFLQQ